MRSVGLIDWFLPEGLREGDLDTLRRARLLVGVALWMGLLLLAMTVSVKVSAGGVIPALPALALACSAAPFIVRLTGSLSLAGHPMLAAAAVATIDSCFILGGLGSPGIYGLALIPTFALAALGRRAALAWAALSVVAFGAIAWLDMTGRFAPTTAAPEHLAAARIFSWIGAFAYLVWMTTLLHSLKDHAMRLLEANVEELEQARFEAEAASRARIEFLARMSHEIRTPMNGVLGMTELILGTELTPTQRRFSENAHGSAQALLRVIDDVLDFSRIEAGKLAVEAAPFDPSRLAEECVELLRDPAESRGLRLSLEADPEAERLLVGDGGRIRQVFLNLLGNAIKFTESGEVAVRLRPSAVTEGGVVMHFEVSDTGIGIATEDLSRLFDAFAQADASTTRRFGGTGLGLAISKQLVELMGGSIGVESEPGTGSTFWFEVPLRLPKLEMEAAPPPSDPTAPPRFEGRVLLVEDNPVNTEVALAMLGQLGLEVEVASNGVDALDRIAEGRYDLIIMDCQMPEMDGFEATRRIRAREETDGAGARVPVVAVTASSLEGDRERCLAAGMDDHLAKPFTRAQLAAVLGGFLPRAADA